MAIKKQKNLEDKIYLFLINLIRISLIFSFFKGIYEFRFLVVFISFIALIFSFLPYFFEKRYKLILPIEFEILIVFFIYSSLFLGEVHGFYTRFFLVGCNSPFWKYDGKGVNWIYNPVYSG
jgi:flagellar biosynthesis protein FliR